VGYRAHIVTQHREYGSQAFYDYAIFERYWEFLRSEYPDEELFEDEHADYFEIPKEVVQAEVIRIQKLDSDKAFEYNPDITNKDMVDVLNRMLKESQGDFISLEWF
jgi:hypothetical protein